MRFKVLMKSNGDLTPTDRKEILIKSQYECHRLNVSDIFNIQSDTDYTFIFT